MKSEILRHEQGMRGAQRLLLIQFSVTLLIALLMLLIGDKTASLSAIAGGIVCVLPNTYFAIKLFRYTGARAARKIVNGFYQGEALKLMLSAALFAMVFNCLTIAPLVFFVAYLAAQMVFWFATLIIANKNRLTRDLNNIKW